MAATGSRLLISQLKRARMDAGLSLMDLAERCGIAQQQIQRWESGVTRPRVDGLVRWAKALDIDIRPVRVVTRGSLWTKP